VLNAVVIQAQTLFLSTSDRIEESNALNKTTVTSAAAVRYRDLIKGPLLLAAA